MIVIVKFFLQQNCVVASCKFMIMVCCMYKMITKCYLFATYILHICMHVYYTYILICMCVHYVSFLVVFSTYLCFNVFYNIPCYNADCYPLFLLKCPQQPHRIGHYILCFKDNKLNVYSTHDGQRVWMWHMGHLRRFCYEPKVPCVEIEPGRLIPNCISFL